MASIGTRTIDINSLQGSTLTMTLNARVTKQFWIRAFIAKCLFALGAWVLKVDLEINE